MSNPFKKDFIEVRINAKISPEKMQAMMDDTIHNNAIISDIWNNYIVRILKNKLFG